MTRPVARVLRRLVIAALVFGAALTGWTVDDAGAWSNGACLTSSGVTVVIDFQELGGGVHIRCAPGAVGSGLEALRQAGIDFQTAVRFPGFVCKIAGRPGNDPCVNTSPASAFWSYWIATRGGQWCYSNWGAGNRTPPQGSVEGWSFSLDKTGSSSPPPRTQAPGSVPGAPSALPANECDQRSAAPTVPSAPPSTAPPVRPAPPPTLPSAPATPASPGGAAASGSESDAAADGSPAAVDDGAGGTAASPPDSVAPEAVGDEPTDADDEAVAGAADERDDAAVRDGRGPARDPSSEDRAATVELGRGEGSGSPVAVLVTAAVIALLAAAAAIGRRRAAER